MRALSSLLTVLMSVMTAVSAGAAPSLPEPGTRIRLTARVPERERWIGSFVSVASDTVTMRDGGLNGVLVTVPTLHVERFEISRGSRNNFLRGAGRGFAAGAILGAGAGLLLYKDNANADPLTWTRTTATLADGILGGVVGGAVGGLVGAMFRSEHWRAVPRKTLRGTARP